jgi:hypothetical protein
MLLDGLRLFPAVIPSTFLFPRCVDMTIGFKNRAISVLSVSVFWIVTPFGLVGIISVSDKITGSIFIDLPLEFRGNILK